MRKLPCGALLLTILLCSSPSIAQPTAQPAEGEDSAVPSPAPAPSAEVEAPAAELEPPAAGSEAPGSAAPTEAVDPPELIALFDHAIGLLIQERFELAERELSEVASRSVNPERRAAAAELARQAAARFRSGSPLMSADESKDRESARAQFLAFTVLLGLNYGWMVPLILDVEDPKPFVGLYLLSASASFAVPYLITRDHDITRGMSIMGGLGSYLGVGHGALLYGLAAGQDRFDGDNELDLLMTTMLATSILEGTAAYMWARNRQASAAHAVSISSGALWGLGYGAGTSVLISGSDLRFRLLMGSMLAGSVAGVAGGHFYNELRHPTEGDASLVLFSGFLGGYASLAPLLIAEVDDARLAAGTIMAGAGLALYAGDVLVKDKDYTRGQSGLISLGGLAGGLLGAGGAFLLAPDGSDVEKWIFSGSAAGAIGGFLVMFQAVEPGGNDGDASRAAVQLTPILGSNGETGLGVAGAF